MFTQTIIVCDKNLLIFFLSIFWNTFSLEFENIKTTTHSLLFQMDRELIVLDFKAAFSHSPPIYIYIHLRTHLLNLIIHSLNVYVLTLDRCLHQKPSKIIVIFTVRLLAFNCHSTETGCNDTTQSGLSEQVKNTCTEVEIYTIATKYGEMLRNDLQSRTCASTIRTERKCWDATL